jgi:hypothetical protein
VRESVSERERERAKKRERERDDLPKGTRVIDTSITISPLVPDQFETGSHRYRGTSLMRNIPPVGPYSSPMPRALWWS